MVSTARLSTWVLIIVLMTAPGMIWLERTYPNLWQQRLAVPDIEPIINRHTPLFPEGKVLPPIITKNTTLTPKDGPIIIAHQVVVPKNITLTIQPGTQLYALEFGQLNIEGNLVAQGTVKNVISFTTDETNLINQTWNGISMNAGAHAQLDYVKFRNASPAIACNTNSQATINHLDIQQGSMGIFTASAACVITNSQILGVQDGVIGQGIIPNISNSRVSGKHSDITTY